MTEPLPPVLHPHWGYVHPLQEQKKAPKVWKHLYNPAEKWDGLVATEVEALWNAAREKGCPAPPSRGGERRDDMPFISKASHALLKEHHDAYYGPAYLRELAHPETQWGRQWREPESLLCCTPRGVLVAVDPQPPAKVRTAYRRDLEPYPDVDDSDYFEGAIHRWRQLTMPAQASWKQEVLRQLEHFTQRPPQRLPELRRLVLAIGHARALVATAPEFSAPLAAAEALLHQAHEKTSPLLNWTSSIDQHLSALASSLANREPEEVQEWLMVLEDDLVTLEVLGGQSEISRIEVHVQPLLTPWPRALTGFQRLTRSRLEVSGPAARGLWSAVLDASSAAFGPMAAAQRWFDEAVARIQERLSDAQLVRESLTGLILNATLEPVGTLHGGAVPEFELRAVGHCRSEWQLRVFIVDAQHPHGEPLLQDTHYTRSGDRWALLEGWRLQGLEDDTLVIAIAAPSLPSTPQLEKLLEESCRLPRSQIQGRWLIPSNGRTP